MNNFNFDVVFNYMEEEFTLNLTSGLSTEDEILEELKRLKIERFEEQSGEGADLGTEANLTDSFEIVSHEIPDFLTGKDGNLDLDKLTEFFEDAPDMDIDIIEAGVNCGVNFSDIEGAYSGRYSSDENFASDMAEQLGAIDNNAQWPNNCIDWELAARELMYDHSEYNGHYFRNI